MSGRKDYEERKQRRIERYEAKAKKNKLESDQRAEQGSKILGAIDGQPLLIGHHSERRHRADLKRIDNNFRKANELQDKSEYYAGKAESAKNNNAISSDDPQAIAKLEQQLYALEKTRENIKKREHKPYELEYVSRDIRRIKDRITELKELDELEFKDIEFVGGKVIRNTEVNRIQVLFDSKPDEETRNILKHRGFRWAKSEMAWQRQFNKNGIWAAKCVVTQLKEKNQNEIQG